MLIAGEALALRVAEDGDRGFILSTWVESYRQQAGVSRAVYLAEQPRLAERLYREHGALVVCSERRPSTIHAWACAAWPTLHYAYTVPELRRQGLLRAMIVATLGDYPRVIDTTHRMPFGSVRFRWNPYPLMRGAV